MLKGIKGRSRRGGGKTMSNLIESVAGGGSVRKLKGNKGRSRR